MRCFSLFTYQAPIRAALKMMIQAIIPIIVIVMVGSGGISLQFDLSKSITSETSSSIPNENEESESNPSISENEEIKDHSACFTDDIANSPSYSTTFYVNSKLSASSFVSTLLRPPRV